MFTILTVGVLSSLATSTINWINTKLSGTALRGDGAFLLAGGIALIGGAFQTWQSGIPFDNLPALWASFSQIWAVSQVFFLAVVNNLRIDVTPPSQG